MDHLCLDTSSTYTLYVFLLCFYHRGMLRSNSTYMSVAIRGEFLSRLAVKPNSRKTYKNNRQLINNGTLSLYPGHGPVAFTQLMSRTCHDVTRVVCTSTLYFQPSSPILLFSQLHHLQSCPCPISTHALFPFIWVGMFSYYWLGRQKTVLRLEVSIWINYRRLKNITGP